MTDQNSDAALARKRRHGVKLVAEFSMGSAVASSLRTPILEVPKQIVLTASDLTLCWRLYALYYDRELSVDNLLGLLQRAGIVTVAGGSVIYTGARIAQGILDELLNMVLFGGVLSGLIAGSYTGGLGLAFLYWIDREWQREQALPAPLPVATGD